MIEPSSPQPAPPTKNVGGAGAATKSASYPTLWRGYQNIIKESSKTSLNEQAYRVTLYRFLCVFLNGIAMIGKLAVSTSKALLRNAEIRTRLQEIPLPPVLLDIVERYEGMKATQAKGISH